MHRRQVKGIVPVASECNSLAECRSSDSRYRAAPANGGWILGIITRGGARGLAGPRLPTVAQMLWWAGRFEMEGIFIARPHPAQGKQFFPDGPHPGRYLVFPLNPHPGPR